MTAAEELTKIRETLGLTIRKFASRLEVPESRYKNWEYGKTNTVPMTILAKARAMLQTPLPLAPLATIATAVDPKITDGFTEFCEVRCWASAVAGLSLDEECWFEVESSPYQIPRAFLRGGYRNVEFHDLVKVSGRSMSPIIEPGDRVLFFQDTSPRKNTVVMAESPEGRVFIKVLRDTGGRWILESVHPDGAVFNDLSGWKIHGYALAILRDPDGEGPNVNWPFGQPIKVAESLRPKR